MALRDRVRDCWVVSGHLCRLPADPLLRPLPHPTVFEFMPYMGITLATIFTMLRLVNEAKMRQVICGGTCPVGACRSGAVRVLQGKRGVRSGWRGC